MVDGSGEQYISCSWHLTTKASILLSPISSQFSSWKGKQTFQWYKIEKKKLFWTNKKVVSSRTPVAQALKVVIMSVSHASQNLSNFPLFPHLQILNLFNQYTYPWLVFFWIRFVQNGSKWIKLDQIWISHLSKNVTIKNCHIYHENKHGQLFWIRSHLSKMDQNG